MIYLTIPIEANWCFLTTLSDILDLEFSIEEYEVNQGITTAAEAGELKIKKYLKTYK